MQNKELQNGISPDRQREEFVFEEKKSAMVSETVTESKKETRPDEFQIPEGISFDEKYNMPLPKEEMPRIWHTYVPRFTGASDGYRTRMEGDASSSEKKSAGGVPQAASNRVRARRRERRRGCFMTVPRILPG